jgi:phage regulator Rha-like protein
MKTKEIYPVETVINKILLVRGQKVILDSVLAELYRVETKKLNEQVKRNIRRFPKDFMFQLTLDEYNSLRSQFETSKGRGGRRYLPYVFTEQGVAMLSSVLNSDRAIEINILIMRAFIKLREILSTNKEVLVKLKEIEEKLQGHDKKILQIIEAINQLLVPPEASKRKIGFEVKEKTVGYRAR